MVVLEMVVLEIVVLEIGILDLVHSRDGRSRDGHSRDRNSRDSRSRDSPSITAASHFPYHLLNCPSWTAPCSFYLDVAHQQRHENPPELLPGGTAGGGFSLPSGHLLPK